MVMDAVSFDINRATGQLTTKAALDYEGGDIGVYIVTVTATDPFGTTAKSDGDHHGDRRERGSDDERGCLDRPR